MKNESRGWSRNAVSQSPFVALRLTLHSALHSAATGTLLDKMDRVLPLQNACSNRGEKGRMGVPFPPVVPLVLYLKTSRGCGNCGKRGLGSGGGFQGLSEDA